MIKKLKKIAEDNGLNVYFLSVADKEYNIEKEEVIPANPNCNCYSVAKAFTVTAIGLLYDQGKLSMNSYITDILYKYLPVDIDEKWKKVTIHDLLLHQVGFGCGMLDIDCEDASLYPNNDYLKMVLSTRLKYEPGTIHQYTDAAYYLLSRVIYEVSGMDIEELLRYLLMNKMRFKEVAWSKCPFGHSIAATGLYIRTEDMAKLGILYLNKGIWKDERILSEEWINMVLSNGYEFKKVKNGWYGKGGMRGQFLVFNMEIGKAIACHSYDDSVRIEKFII